MWTLTLFIYFIRKDKSIMGKPDPDLPHVTNAAMSSRACSTAASISRCTCFYSCITLTTALDFVLVFSFAVDYQSFLFVH